MLHTQGRTQDFGAGGGGSGVTWVEWWCRKTSAEGARKFRGFQKFLK
jgi:hypothetical protein